MVVDSQEPSPVAALEALHANAQLPALLGAGMLDSSLLRHYLVLHDSHRGGSDIQRHEPLHIRRTLLAHVCFTSGQAVACILAAAL